MDIAGMDREGGQGGRSLTRPARLAARMLSSYLSVCLSICLSICLSVCLSVCLASVYLSTQLSVYEHSSVRHTGCWRAWVRAGTGHAREPGQEQPVTD